MHFQCFHVYNTCLVCAAVDCILRMFFVLFCFFVKRPFILLASSICLADLSASSICTFFFKLPGLWPLILLNILRHCRLQDYVEGLTQQKKAMSIKIIQNNFWTTSRIRGLPVSNTLSIWYCVQWEYWICKILTYLITNLSLVCFKKKNMASWNVLSNSSTITMVCTLMCLQIPQVRPSKWQIFPN